MIGDHNKYYPERGPLLRCYGDSLVRKDWRDAVRGYYQAPAIGDMPDSRPRLMGEPLGERCTDTAHDDAGAWCVRCQNTGWLPAPAPRPCRSVP